MSFTRDRPAVPTIGGQDGAGWAVCPRRPAGRYGGRRRPGTRAFLREAVSVLTLCAGLRRDGSRGGDASGRPDADPGWRAGDDVSAACACLFWPALVGGVALPRLICRSRRPLRN